MARRVVPLHMTGGRRGKPLDGVASRVPPAVPAPASASCNRRFPAPTHMLPGSPFVFRIQPAPYRANWT